MNALQEKILDVFEIEVDSSKISEEEANEMARALARLIPDDAKQLAARLMIYFCEPNTLLPYASSGDHLIFFLDGSPRSGDGDESVLNDMSEDALRVFSVDE